MTNQLRVRTGDEVLGVSREMRRYEIVFEENKTLKGSEDTKMIS